MTFAIPSLSQAFSALGGLFNAPKQTASVGSAFPAVPQVSAPQVGVSSPSALGLSAAPGAQTFGAGPGVATTTPKAATPAVPSLSVPSPTSYGMSVSGPAGVGSYVPYPNGQGGAYQPYSGAGGQSVASAPSPTPAVPTSPTSGGFSPASGPQTFGAGTGAPAVPQFSAPVTAPSGTVVDPNTGGVVAPSSDASAFTADSNAGLAFGSNTGNASSVSNYSSAAGGGVGTVPAGWDAQSYANFKAANPGIEPTDEDLKRYKAGASGSGTDTLFNSPADQAAYDAYIKSLGMSDEEKAAQQNLNALTNASSMAYTNTQNQPIALPFITGQQAALQRESATLAQPLEQQLALAQAQRQLGSTGAKAALDRQDAILAAKRDLATKTINTTYGGTTAQFNPATGKYETVVNPFGTTGGSGATDITTTIGNAIANGQLTQDQVTRYGIPFIASTLASDPGYNFITQKASVSSDTASLKTQQAYADSTSRAFNTANANLAQLVGFMTTQGVNQSAVPAINQLQNRVKSGLSDAGTIAAFNAALAGLRAEYAQVLSRGGEVTEGQRAQAAQLIPDDISPAQLQQVADRLNIEGTNAVTEANAKVTEIQGRLKGNSGGSSSSSSSSSSASIYDF